MEYVNLILLSIFQGISEFLPISSSGHLSVLGKVLKLESENSFTLVVFLHFGTLFSMALFYAKDIIRIFTKRDFKFIFQLFVASLPAAIVGFSIKLLNFDDKIFNNQILIGCTFLITALLLIFLDKAQKREHEFVEIKNLSWKSLLGIGAMQAFAILPGISRAGSTIFAGVQSKLSAKDSAKLSFFMGMIAIGGATLLEIISLVKDNELSNISSNLLYYLTGFVVAFASGYISLKLLIKLLTNGKLSYFSIYLVIVSILTFILYFV